MTPGIFFDRQLMMSLFSDMSGLLSQRGEHAQVFVVGGAAMALAYDEKRTTQDIDGAFEPATLVRQLAVEIGAKRGLVKDWLNDAVKGFLPGDDKNPSTVYESEWLLVQVASAQYLLAMKLFAARRGRDDFDCVKLFNLCGLENADDALDILSSYYQTDLLTARHMYFAQDIAQQAALKPPAE